MLYDIAFGLSAVLVGLSFLAIFAMFVAAGVLSWHLVAETLRQRRDTADALSLLDAERALRKS